MSEPRDAVPLGEKVTDEVGNRICTWQDTAQVITALHKVNKRGQYPVTVKFHDAVVGHGTVDMLNLADRERLQAHCRHLDGAVNWLERFVEVSQDLSALDGPQRTLEVTQLSTVRPERVDFWWKPYLPKGRPVALEGDPGVGKSALVLKLVAHLTTGTAFPNLYDYLPPPRDFSPQDICLLTSEDDPGDTILPRVVVNGGDASRVHLITGWTKPDGERGVLTMQDLLLLELALTTYHPALLVFDPIQSFFGPHIDMNHANETRPVLDAVAALCKSHGCTPLYVRHIGKAAHAKALYAGLGSIDIAANMRAVLFLGKDPDNAERRILAQSKSNNARLGPSMAYLITTVEQDIETDDGAVTVEAPRLDWDGRSDLTANDLSAPAPLEKESTINALDAATDFVREVLKDAPVLVDDIKAAAKENSIAWITVRRAKKELPVRARRREVEGRNAREWPWEWYLSVEDEETRWES